MLEILGLTPAEQALYERMVAHHPATVSDSATLVRLVELGLVTEVATDPPKYVVIPPETALARLADTRDRELDRARRHMIGLAVRFHGAAPRRDPAGLVEVVTGAEIVQAGDRLMRSARREVCGWEAPPYHGNPTEVNPVEMDQLRRGVRYRVVYDRATVIGQAGRVAELLTGIHSGEQARVADVPLKLWLSDRPMALVPLDTGAARLDAVLVVRDPTICAALQALFELYWERAVPLATLQNGAPQPDPGGPTPAELPTGVPQPDPGGPTPAERDLLVLLLSGSTDAQMAAHLGCSERTIRQRLNAMRDRLGAHTRFQAGYQAVLRGWLAADGAVTNG
ncbi:MAG TPA: LuxR C-terminal-related transcriptional regulator [Candidatus Limnocylindrales bacterium]